MVSLLEIEKRTIITVSPLFNLSKEIGLSHRVRIEYIFLYNDTALNNKKPAKPYDLRVYEFVCILLDLYLGEKDTN